MNNLHISLTDFTHESRVLKIIRSLSSAELVDKAFVAALHPPGLPEDEILKPDIEIKRFRLHSRNLSKVFFIQLFKYFEFAYRVYKHYRDKEIGMINIHSLALLPLGVFLKKKYRAELIYDTHELETETEGLFGMRKLFSKIVEKFFIKQADLVVVVGDLIADWYEDTYKIQRPLVLLNVPNYKEVQKKDILRDMLGIADHERIFLYQGGLAQGRGIELILETFKSNRPVNSVVVFMGYGPLENTIKEAARECNAIYYLPSVPVEKILDYTSSADFGLSIIEASCLSYYYCLPNKLFECLMAEIPVVVSNMKEMARLVRDNNLGVVVENLTPQGIMDAISAFDISDVNELKRNIKAVKKEYSWETQENRLVTAYRALLARKM
jgi:glycosyltransferase involved in cell wall biosynthesis